MSGPRRFESLTVKSAADVETWHPDLEILVRYDLPFICFDPEGSAVHISRTATMLLARHRHVDAMFEALRNASNELLERDRTDGATPRPRASSRVTDPGDGGFWSVHVVRTRHDWPIAIAVSEGARIAHADTQIRERLTRRELEVASLVADGAPAKNVAAALSITVHTARRHTEQVFRKLGVHSRAELTHVVLRNRDVGLEPSHRAPAVRFSGAA